MTQLSSGLLAHHAPPTLDSAVRLLEMAKVADHPDWVFRQAYGDGVERMSADVLSALLRRGYKPPAQLTLPLLANLRNPACELLLLLSLTAPPPDWPETPTQELSLAWWTVLVRRWPHQYPARLLAKLCTSAVFGTFSSRPSQVAEALLYLATESPESLSPDTPLLKRLTAIGIPMARRPDWRWVLACGCLCRRYEDPRLRPLYEVFRNTPLDTREPWYEWHWKLRLETVEALLSSGFWQEKEGLEAQRTLLLAMKVNEFVADPALESLPGRWQARPPLVEPAWLVDE